MSTFTGISLKTMQFTLKPNGILHFNNFKIVKFDDNIQPFVLVKTAILNNQDIQAWNTRKLILFNFEDTNTYGSLNSEVGKVIAQYTNIDFTSYNFDGFNFADYTVFKIIKIKKASEQVFKNIQEEITAFDVNGDVSGTQLENINISNQSFNTNSTTILINSTQKGGFFMFGFKCDPTKTNLFTTDEQSAITETIDNMIYIFDNNFTTGFLNGAVPSEIKFKLLMDNTEEVEIINTSPVSNYNISFNNTTISPSTSNSVISVGTSSIITLFVEIISGVTDSKINLRFSSNDIIFNTFVPELKQIGGNSYLVSSRPSGLNPDLYIFNISVFKISAVDRITRSTTSVISLNNTRDIEVFIEPDLKTEYFGGQTPLVNPLTIQITNNNPTIFDMPNQITFPDISGSDINNTIFTIASTANPSNLNNVLSVDFTVQTASALFQNLTIPSLSIQVASIQTQGNITKCFINTSSPIQYNPIVTIETAPGTLEDASSATLTGTNVQRPITPQTFTFSVQVIDGQFVIEYETNLQVDQISKRFSAIDDVNFQAYEGDIYIFDTSHPSNQNHLMTFFSSNTINSNNELVSGVVYDNNINQGSVGSKITLTVPLNSQFSNIYISDFPSGEDRQNKLTGLCRINILPNPTNIDVGTFNFTLLVGNGTSTMSLVPNVDINNIPISGINDLTIGNDAGNTDADRILELFSGESPIPTIQVYPIYLSKPENLEFVVFNKTYVLLTWNVTNNANIYPFANPRESRYPIDVYYNIYREDADTNNISLLGTSIINSFTDITPENFNNYNYYIESVATWEGLTMTSQKSNALFVFVCENNRFPDGRWNNSFSNPKLYKELSTCSNRNNITSSLFPNSWSLSRKETYARLAKLSINKR